MQLQFFPSKTMALYMARMFLVRSFAVLALLVIVLQTLDLLGESGKILAQPGNGDAELWRYIGLRVPQIINRFLPFSVRSEERRVGQEWVSPCSSRWGPD